jgi:hypothetical protein
LASPRSVSIKSKLIRQRAPGRGSRRKHYTYVYLPFTRLLRCVGMEIQVVLCCNNVGITQILVCCALCLQCISASAGYTQRGV